jgi:hypothetical protein
MSDFIAATFAPSRRQLATESDPPAGEACGSDVQAAVVIEVGNLRIRRIPTTPLKGVET